MFKFIFVLTIFWIIKFSFSDDVTMRIKSYKCTASGKSVAPDFKCFARSFNRNFTTMNFRFNVTRQSMTTKVSNSVEIAVMK